MITHIILNLPEEYQTKIEILEEKLDDKDSPLNIKRIHDELLYKYVRSHKDGPSSR